jgi:hypothetical protein
MAIQDERQEALDKFRKYVISQARRNLTMQGKKASGALYKSLNGNLRAMPNSVRLFFEMEEYGFYQDKGVKGIKSGRSLSGFRFGSGRGPKGGLTKGIRQWVALKGIQFRDKKGRFVTKEATVQTIVRSIYNKGIKPSMFFTKPFEKAFKYLPDEMIEAFGFDAEKLFDMIMKENMKNYGYK